MFTEILLFILLALPLWDFFYKRRRNQLLDKTGIPGPRALPIVGNALYLIGGSTTTIFTLLTQLTKKYGKTVRLWLFTDCVIMTQDAKYFESILSSQKLLKKNITYNLLDEWLGEGLLLSTGAKWFSRRRIITPTFHFKILEDFCEVFDQQTDIMIKRLTKKADGRTIVNMFHETCLTTLDIIAETAMGVKIHAQEHSDLPYSKAVNDASEITGMRFANPLHRRDWYFKTFRYKDSQRLQHSIKIMHDFTDKVIQERRDALQSSIDAGTFKGATDETGVKKRMALLDVLLQSTESEKPLTNKDIREEVDIFMFAGHDTTTTAISFTCYLLSRHPQVQQKVYEEVMQKIGKNRERPLAIRDLQELHYLDKVIKESLRLYPPGSIIGRRTEEDIEINGQLIPAQTSFTLLLFAAMRDPDNFMRPNEFIPERFADDAGMEKLNPFAYVPFSAGPRNCIGQKFAMLEMKCILSKLISNFELLPLGEDIKLMINIVLRSTTGMQMGLKLRT